MEEVVIVLSQKGVRKFLTIPLSFVLITPKVEAIKLDATADHCMLYLSVLKARFICIQRIISFTSHLLVILLFQTYDHTMFVSFNSNTTGDTCRAGATYLSIAPRLFPSVGVGSCCLIC